MWIALMVNYLICVFHHHRRPCVGRIKKAKFPKDYLEIVRRAIASPLSCTHRFAQHSYINPFDLPSLFPIGYYFSKSDLWNFIVWKGRKK